MFYPGSKTPVKVFGDGQPVKPADSAQDIFLGKPQILSLRGTPTEFYKVGILAAVLNRKPVTIRKWETDGIIPKAVFVLPGEDIRGRRRLYTRDQILGLRTIAEEEGLLEPSNGGRWKSIEATNFKERALKLFKELE